VILSDFGAESLERGARALAPLVGDANHAERARRCARDELSLDDVGIPRYDRLYRRLAAGPSALSTDCRYPRRLV